MFQKLISLKSADRRFLCYSETSIRIFRGSKIEKRLGGIFRTFRSPWIKQIKTKRGQLGLRKIWQKFAWIRPGNLKLKVFRHLFQPHLIITFTRHFFFFLGCLMPWAGWFKRSSCRIEEFKINWWSLFLTSIPHAHASLQSRLKSPIESQNKWYPPAHSFFDDFDDETILPPWKHGQLGSERPDRFFLQISSLKTQR